MINQLDQIKLLIEQSANPSLKNYLDQLIQYAEDMAPDKTMNAEQGARHQAALYSTIECFLENTRDFALGFSALLITFHHFRNGAMSPMYAYRFMEHVQLPKQKQLAMNKILDLLIMTCTPDISKRLDVLKHINIARSVAQPFSDTARMNVAQYFNK